MTDKQKKFRSRWTTYNTAVQNYNRGRARDRRIPLLSFEEVKSYDIEHDFWNIGHLTHPNEKWAVDLNTQRGIEAFLNVRGCKEELRRIAQEVRQMVLFALSTEERLKVFSSACDKRTYVDDLHDFPVLALTGTIWVWWCAAWVPGFPDGTRPIELVQAGRLVNRGLWDESQNALKVLHSSLALKYCKRWMLWDSHIPQLISTTQKYLKTPIQYDDTLMLSWRQLIERSKKVWDVNTLNLYGIIASEELDELDVMEHQLAHMSDEEDRFGDLGDVERLDAFWEDEDDDDGHNYTWS